MLIKNNWLWVGNGNFMAAGRFVSWKLTRHFRALAEMLIPTFFLGEQSPFVWGPVFTHNPQTAIIGVVLEDWEITAKQASVVASAARPTIDSCQVVKHRPPHKCSKHVDLDWKDGTKCYCYYLHYSITHCSDCAVWWPDCGVHIKNDKWENIQRRWRRPWWPLLRERQGWMIGFHLGHTKRHTDTPCMGMCVLV